MQNLWNQATIYPPSALDLDPSARETEASPGMLQKAVRTPIHHGYRTRVPTFPKYSAAVHQHPSRRPIGLLRRQPFALRTQDLGHSHISSACCLQRKYDAFRSYATQTDVVPPSSDFPFRIIKDERGTLPKRSSTVEEGGKGWKHQELIDKPVTREQLRQWHENYIEDNLRNKDEHHSEEDLQRSWHLANPIFRVGQGDGITASEATRSSTEIGEDLDDDPSLNSAHNLGFDPESQFTWRTQIVPRKGDLLLVANRSALHVINFVVALHVEGDTLITYDSSGRWRRRFEIQANLFHHRIPGLFDESTIDRMLAYIPAPTAKDEEAPTSNVGGSEGDQIPRTVASPILNKIKAYEQEALSFSHEHAMKLDTAWETLANDVETQMISMDDISRRLFDIPVEELSLPSRLTLISALYSDSLKIRGSFQGSHKGLMYIIEPKDRVHSMQQVVLWARHYQKAISETAQGRALETEIQQNPIGQFIQKARHAIIQSRTLRSPTIMGTLGPSAAISKAEGIRAQKNVAFSDQDRQILRFLIDAAGWHPVTAVSVCAVRCMILRAVGAYPAMTLDVTTARLFLQELGVLPPWHFIRMFDPIFNIAGTGSVPQLDKMLSGSSRPEKHDWKQCNTDMSLDLRTDWGDLPAFCIDSASTVDHDDAFSLDPVAGRDDRWWIRVHIADPGAFISPEHLFAKFAAKARQSIYLAEHNVPMMPHEITRGRFGIERGRPVLTFSLLVSEADGILETEIKPGRIHNVIFATPSALMKTLGGEEPPSVELNIGVDPPKEFADEKDVARLQPHVETLKRISELIRAVEQRRESKIARFFEHNAIRYDTQVFVSNLPKQERRNSLSQSQVYIGDPYIRVSSKSRLWSDLYSNDIVGLVMLHTNEAAAGWCRARGIPIPYVSCVFHPDYPLDKMVALKEFEVHHLPSTQLTAEPRRYENLGVDQYTRVTSPLRRYWDLLTHWQIHAYLRSEIGNRPLTLPQRQSLSRLPFNKNSIDDLIREHEFIELQQKRIHGMNNVHWTTYALFRALHFQEGPLPEVFYLSLVMQKNEMSFDGHKVVFRGRMVPFGMPGMLLKSEDGHENGAEVGEIMPCRLSKVNVDRSMCYLVPIGPPLGEEYFTRNTFLGKCLDFTAAEYDRLRHEYEIHER